MNVFCPTNVISAINLNYMIYSLAADKDTNEQGYNMKIAKGTLYLRLINSLIEDEYYFVPYLLTIELYLLTVGSYLLIFVAF